MIADEYLPAYDVVMRHAVRVPAPAPAVWAALHRPTSGAPGTCARCSRSEGLRRPRGGQRLTLDRLVRGGFIPLGERAGREIALGLIGRFWLLSGGRVTSTAEEFRHFARPAHAKVVWTFTVEAEGPAITRLVTETRVQCLDAASRRRFGLYWLVVRPFSGLIRHAMLRAVAREATRPVLARPV